MSVDLEFESEMDKHSETISALSRANSPARKLIRNAAKCTICGDIVESKYRHDFRACKCGRIFVDGGLEYVRRGFSEPSDIEDLSEYA